MPLRRGPAISTPKEHGALAVLLGSGGLAITVSPDRFPSSAVIALFLLFFLARGPLERWVRKFKLRRWDRGAVLFYGLGVASATYLTARSEPLIAISALCCAGAMLAGGVAAQKLRIHRSLVVELGGMATFAVMTAMAIIAGDGSSSLAIMAAISMGSYAMASVFLVRGQLRELTPSLRLVYGRLALVLFGLGAAVAGWFEPILLIAFGPRMVQMGYRSVVQPRVQTATQIATTEVAQLIAFAALLALLLHM